MVSVGGIFVAVSVTQMTVLVSALAYCGSLDRSLEVMVIRIEVD